MSDVDAPAMMVGSIAQLNDTPGESPAIGFHVWGAVWPPPKRPPHSAIARAIRDAFYRANEGLPQAPMATRTWSACADAVLGVQAGVEGETI